MGNPSAALVATALWMGTLHQVMKGTLTKPPPAPTRPDRKPITPPAAIWPAPPGIWREGAKAPSNRGVSAINISYGAFDPFTFAIRFLKTEMVPPASNNWGYFSEPDYDALMDSIYNEFDPAKQEKLLQQLHGKLVDDRLFLFVAHDMNPRAMSAKVQGFVQAQSWFQDLTPISLR